MMQWFKHGKWPHWMVRVHYYSIASFIFLLLSGIALFWQPVHTILIPYLPVLYQLHIAFGLIFAVTLLVPFAAKLPIGKLLRRLDWLFPLTLGASIVLTGIFLWKVTWFPTTWRSLAFRWHGWISYVLGGWLIIHAIYKAVGYRPAKEGINGYIDPERRRFLKWLGYGVVGTVVLTVVDPARLWNGLTSPGASSTPTTGAFAEYYTVVNGYPKETLSSYKLQIDGLVGNPTTLDWTRLQQLAAVSQKEDFHCVTGWSVAGVEWTGVHLSSLASLVSPTSAVKYVHFYSFDGVYTESLSLTEAMDKSVMLAYKLNGAPLSTPQGYPVRLVVPKMYGYKSIKWVNRVEFSDKPLTGYWEDRGYPNEAYIGSSI
ncbi:molybdopterin-dependent oxidoreductase [Alicyclobacillus curvatus]|nr:molybdopterin-dependent oxidoreductase [Alicyclobacillus curvatus]